ncbi:fungal specific transcription factor domain-containing protein [Sarocladium implicatum]|nr:fungal specific transcription factor domain-containing protein [Sarocladium implicatum]
MIQQMKAVEAAVAANGGTSDQHYGGRRSRSHFRRSQPRLSIRTSAPSAMDDDAIPYSIRQVVTSRVETNAFAPESSRFSVLEVASSQQNSRPAGQGTPSIWPNTVPEAVYRYQSTTSGVIDLFDNERLLDDVQLWASLDRKPQSSTSIINYLILAIGLRTSDDAKAEEYFEYSLSRALTGLSSTLSVATVQAFALITMYMLCTCQINGAFLYFGIAVRAAYTVGIHRSEVNSRFGPEIHAQRDRLWKSLRIVDLYLSTSMGRPPATSDVDCSVPYKATGPDGMETYDLLNASVQILLITERIVEEIYSRKKISLQLTEGISVQLREWSATWLQRLKRSEPDATWNIEYNGACQIMSTYYYAVMLVSRPFLMYELYRNLDGPQASGRLSLATGKSKLADACIDSASLMVESIQDGIGRSSFTSLSRTNSCMPLLVPWLFASSLVLGVGLLGGFGRVLEKRCRQSIEALDHFARHDAHAEQYSLIAQSLLSVSLEHLEKKELSERMQRTESSSQLFGLLPSRRPSLNSPNMGGTPPHHAHTPAGMVTRGRDIPGRDITQNGGLLSISSPGLGEVDSAFLGLTDNGLHPTDGGYWGTAVGSDADQASALNLFTLLDSGGGIDLAHYL